MKEVIRKACDPNPKCLELGYCGRFCGMCNLEIWVDSERRLQEDKRVINKYSLFGECRIAGRCLDGICKNIAQSSMKKGYDESE